MKSSHPPSAKPFKANSCDHHYTQCPCPLQVHNFVDANSETNHRNMRTPMLALVGSLCCLATGLILVLVFSHVFVVPHLRTQELISAQCYVESIESRNTRTNAPCIMGNVTASGWEIGTNEGEDPAKDFYDTNLDTSAGKSQYEDNSSKRNARNFLETKLHAQDIPDIVEATDSSKLDYTRPVFTNCQDDICHIVKVQYNDLRGSLKTGVLYSSGILEYTGEVEDKCFCKSDCELLSSGTVLRLTLDDREVETGLRTHCFYRRQVEVPAHGRLHNLILLNMMLWPTVLFILGFVGLFFSCIHYQKDVTDRVALRKRLEKNRS